MHALSFRRFRDVLRHWIERVFHHAPHGPNAADEFESFFNR